MSKSLEDMTLDELLDELEAASAEASDDFITSADRKSGYTNEHGAEMVEEIREIILRKYGRSA